MTEPDRRPEVFRLEVEAIAEHMATVRLFVATVARVLRLDEALVADIKLAASEAATAIVRATRSQVVVVEMERTDDQVVMSISPLDIEMLEGDPPRAVDIIEALFPTSVLDERRSTLRVPVGPGPVP